MGYVWAALEQAMKKEEVICRALAGTLTWIQAAEILGIDPRSLRRWQADRSTDQLTPQRCHQSVTNGPQPSATDGHLAHMIVRRCARESVRKHSAKHNLPGRI